jgi:hypothetical protein
MRFFVGRHVGPVWMGASFGPFHPARILNAGGSGARQFNTLALFGMFIWGALIAWLCLR